MRSIVIRAVLAASMIGASALAVMPRTAFCQAYARTDNASLEARVRVLEDHIEIEHLLMEYGSALDHRDFKAFSQLFASDGEWIGNIGTFRGPAAIRAAMEKVFKARGTGSAPPASFHLLTNAIIDVHGDRAVATSRWTFVRIVHGKPVIELAGVYDDTLVRQDGHWRFLRRMAPATGGAPASR
jgi:uncharacterized protein (TIGR02246 family)